MFLLSDAPNLSDAELKAADVTFSYGELEAVIASVFNAQSADALPKLRARYKKLQLLGIPTGPRPTRGQRFRYSLIQLAEVTLCLEFAEFGFDPSFIANILILHSHEYKSEDFPEVLPFTFVVSMLLSISILQRLNHYTLVAFEPSLMSAKWSLGDNFSIWLGRSEDRFSDALGVDCPRLIIVNMINLATRFREGIRTLYPLWPRMVDGHNPQA